jgi:hypothetical protein
MGFEEFVALICEIPDSEAQAHFRSQNEFIVDDEQNLIVDFVGKFESLERDFTVVAEKIGIGVELPHIRQTSAADYRQMYTDRAAAMVAERYRKDITLFDYKF